MPLIDPDLIPAHVLSRKSVNDLNELYDRLEARKLDRLVVPEPPSGFRASNLIRAYSQSHLRRCIVLARSAYDLFFVENGLISMMAVRAMYETVAVFCAFESQFIRLVESGTLQQIFEFAQNKAHATRSKKMIAQHGPQVTATNLLTDIKKLASVRANVEDEYDFLSEHVHPAGFGTVLYFGERLKDDDVYIFSDGGPDPAADLQWIMIGIKLLEEFEISYDRVEAVLPGLTQRGHIEKQKA